MRFDLQNRSHNSRGKRVRPFCSIAPKKKKKKKKKQSISGMGRRLYKIEGEKVDDTNI